MKKVHKVHKIVHKIFATKDIFYYICIIINKQKQNKMTTEVKNKAIETMKNIQTGIYEQTKRGNYEIASALTYCNETIGDAINADELDEISLNNLIDYVKLMGWCM